jgi:hypothetical protein
MDADADRFRLPPPPLVMRVMRVAQVAVVFAVLVVSVSSLLFDWVPRWAMLGAYGGLFVMSLFSLVVGWAVMRHVTPSRRQYRDILAEAERLRKGMS